MLNYTLHLITKYQMELFKRDYLSLTFLFSFSVYSHLLLNGLQAMVSKIKASFTVAVLSFFTY